MQMGHTYVRLVSPDDVVHLVSLRVYEESLVRGRGEFAAACGLVILAASMTADSSHECTLCRVSVRTA
jgi:hypothetical protein